MFTRESESVRGL